MSDHKEHVILKVQCENTWGGFQQELGKKHGWLANRNAYNFGINISVDLALSYFCTKWCES